MPRTSKAKAPVVMESRVLTSRELAETLAGLGTNVPAAAGMQS